MKKYQMMFDEGDKKIEAAKNCGPLRAEINYGIFVN